MKTKSSQQIRQLESEKSDIEVEIDGIHRSIDERNKRAAELRLRLRDVDKEISDIRKSQEDIVVTDHAFLRYLERAMGIEVDELKEQMVPDNVEITMKRMGSGKYPLGNGLHAVVKGNTIVTVVPVKYGS